VKLTAKPESSNPELPDNAGNISDSKAAVLLTIPEVAHYLKLSRRTTWRWCKSGQLPAFKVGHQWRVAQSDLDRFIQRRNRENF
jgi:excisionase family DNA binding protein